MSITINIKNKKALRILKSLEDINFIEVEGKYPTKTTGKKDEHQSGKNNFFQLNGIWKNRDVDIDIIRNKAWKRQ